jgi:hypothetical protein
MLQSPVQFVTQSSAFFQENKKKKENKNQERKKKKGEMASSFSRGRVAVLFPVPW